MLLWALADDRALAPAARRAIEREADAVLVSAASIWEIAIKSALGRVAVDPGVDLAAAALDAGFEELPVAFDHASTVAALPDLHRDPFDRILVAQALADDLVLATADDQVMRYEVPCLSARR